MLSNNKLNVAMIHDWFSGEFSGGAEKVFKEIEDIVIESDYYYEIFCLVNHINKKNKKNKGKIINITFIQIYHWKHFHKYLPLFPLAIEQHDLREYDLILS